MKIIQFPNTTPPASNFENNECGDRIAAFINFDSFTNYIG